MQCSPSFALARHIGGWLGSDKLFFESISFARDMYVASESAGPKVKILPRNQMNVAVVNFRHSLVRSFVRWCRCPALVAKYLALAFGIAIWHLAFGIWHLAFGIGIGI